MGFKTTDPEAYAAKFNRPDYFTNKGKEYVFIVSSMLAQLLNQAGTSCILTLIEPVSAKFDLDAASANWLMAAFALAAGTFILSSGRVGDVYGLKATMLGGYAWTTLWSLLCGIARYSSTPEFFIVCRAFQGVGLAFILPNVVGIVGNVYKPHTLRKNMVFSLIGACAPIGAALGVIFSGLIATYTPRWDWAFYAYCIAAAICGVLAWWSVPNNIPRNSHNLKMDWVGSGLGISALVLFNFVWNQAPAVGWSNAYIITLLPVSVVLFALFILYELKFASHPLLPKEVLCNVRIMPILLAVFLGWGSFGVWIFYYFEFVQGLRGYSPLWAGGGFFIVIIFGALAAISCGLLIGHLHITVIFLFSMLAFCVGDVMFAVTPVDQSFWRMSMGTLMIIVFGMDWSFPASSITLSNELPPDYQGMAGSLTNTMINYSMSLFLGIAGTVERQVLNHGTTTLDAYRAALYFSIGVSGLAVTVALSLLVTAIFIKGEKVYTTSPGPEITSQVSKGTHASEFS